MIIMTCRDMDRDQIWMVLPFLLDMGDRNWAISTSGFGITAFTDAGQEYTIEQISTELKDDDYYEAFEDFTSLCDEFLTQAKTGEAYDTDHLPKETPGLFWIPADLLIGLGNRTDHWAYQEKQTDVCKAKSKCTGLCGARQHTAYHQTGLIW